MATAYIQNTPDLVGHGNQSLREAALKIIESGLQACDPYHATRMVVCLQDNHLNIGDLSLDLEEYEHIFVLGAGKATLPIAQALEDILEARISSGIIVLKDGCCADLNYIAPIYSSHPIPDENGYLAARSMMAMAKGFTEKDLVITAFTGGSSALLPLPVDGVTLEEKKKVNEILLACGADITQINTIRKHLSKIKGGWLAKTIFPANIVNLSVSDVVGDMLDYITDPTVPDTSTFADARRVMDEFDLWENFPKSASHYLKSGSDINETPKDFAGNSVHTFLLVDSTAACLGAAEKSLELGFQPMILTTMLKGEAREAGILFASIGKEIHKFDRPIAKPCVIIAGGENTVTINASHGLGGPNQEFILSVSQEIAGLDDIVAASIDTDGSDGPTELAGGIVDGQSALSAAKKGWNLADTLKHHNATSLLKDTADGILTGPTGTNVNDLKLLLLA